MTASPPSTSWSTVSGPVGIDDSPAPGNSTLTNDRSWPSGKAARTKSQATRSCVVPW